MQTITQFEAKYRKTATAQVRSGDSVRVHHQIKEGAKSRIQMFEGVVVRTRRLGSIQGDFTVRRIASGVGVEKTFLLHSPNVVTVDILRRSKVRRNFLTYLRARRGKSARLQEIAFDKLGVNAAGVAVQLPEAAEIEEIVATSDQVDESTVSVVSTEELATAENNEAASGDAPAETASGDSADENKLAAEETEAGAEKAAKAEDKETAK
jgi:large subunit ribosomal protein L19